MFLPKFNEKFITHWEDTLGFSLSFMAEDCNEPLVLYLNILYSVATTKNNPYLLNFFSELQKHGPIEQTLFHALRSIEIIEPEKYSHALDVLGFLVIGKNLDVTTKELLSVTEKIDPNNSHINEDLIRFINLFSSIENSNENKDIVLQEIEKRYSKINRSRASVFNFVSLDLQNSINTYFGDYLTDEQYTQFCPDLDMTSGIEVADLYSSFIQLNINKIINYYQLSSDSYTNLRLNITSMFSILQLSSKANYTGDIKQYFLPNTQYGYTDTIIQEPHVQKTFKFLSLQDKNTFDHTLCELLKVFIPTQCHDRIKKVDMENVMTTTLQYMQLNNKIEHKNKPNKKIKI